MPLVICLTCTPRQCPLCLLPHQLGRDPFDAPDALSTMARSVLSSTGLSRRLITRAQSLVGYPHVQAWQVARATGLLGHQDLTGYQENGLSRRGEMG